MYSEDCLNVPFPRISNPNASSDPAEPSPNRNAYWSASITTLAAAIAGVSLLASPITADAFWPFSTVSQAATDPSPIVHDSSMPLLAAAVNPDPNPEKGGSDIALTGDSALIANSGPDGTAADIVHDSSGGEITTYTVAEGDTFSSIAVKNGISVNTILWANDLTPKSTLKTGETLVILPVTGIEHTVQKGETVASIAKKYGGDAQEIITYNGLSDGTVSAGEKIIIPDGELPVTASSSKTKSSSSTVHRTVNLPVVSGLGNPLDGAGVCTQGIHDNNAVDIGAPAGTPIYAAAAGSVIIANSSDTWGHGWGYYVVINHPNGVQTLYAHMSSVASSVGESVTKGELIGYVGRTGKATGNHLHFEVHKARNPFCANM